MQLSVRLTVITAGLLLAATTGNAQQVVFGLAGGGTYSDFSHPDTPSRWGYTAGLFVGVKSYRSLNMLDVSYTQKGGEGARIDYVEASVTGGGLARGGGGSGARPYIGFSVAFPVSCDAPSAPLNAFCDNTNTEWGIPVGLMLGKFKPTGGFIGLDARYTIAINDASLNVYNNTWMFRLMIGRPK